MIHLYNTLFFIQFVLCPAIRLLDFFKARHDELIHELITLHKFYEINRWLCKIGIRLWYTKLLGLIRPDFSSFAQSYSLTCYRLQLSPILHSINLKLRKNQAQKLFQAKKQGRLGTCLPTVSWQGNIFLENF